VVVHERAVGGTVEWYTPPSLFDALGVAFDLDPAAGRDKLEAATWSAVPASAFYTADQDGLGMPWYGHVWLNPPYGPAAVPFVDRMIDHADGLLLLPSRTETKVYQRAIMAANAVCLLRDRLWFRRLGGQTGRSSFGSTIFAFGEWAVDRLDAAKIGAIVAAVRWP
jgi:hypothetical protein